MSEHHPDHPADAAETPRIAAPSIPGHPDAPRVEHEAESAVARTEIAVDDLLREIGTLDGGSPPSPASTQGKASDWFTAAVARLGSDASVPEPAAAAPSVPFEDATDAADDIPDRAPIDAAEEPHRGAAALPNPASVADANATEEVRAAASRPAEPTLEIPAEHHEPGAGDRPSEGNALDELDELDELAHHAAPPPPDSADSSGSGPGGVSTSPPGDAAEDPRLHQIDGELAEDAEVLLGANFETVSEVLDGDDVLPPDDHLVPEPAPTAGRSPAPGIMAPGSEELPGRSHEPGAFEVREEPIAIPPGVPADPADVAPVVSELIPPRDRPAPEPAGSNEMLPERGSEDEEIAAEPTDLVGALPDAALDPVEVDTPPPAVVERPAPRSSSFLGRLEPPIITVLRWVNAPLRRVPPGARPIVDWIALSLVFWVPVVWAVALLMVGR